MNEEILVTKRVTYTMEHDGQIYNVENVPTPRSYTRGKKKQ